MPLRGLSAICSKRGVASLMCLVGITGLARCGDGPVTTVGDVPHSRFIARTPDAVGTIVFVHGFLGAATATWTHPGTGAFFPQLVADDPTFDGYDVYVYEYESPLVKSALSIGELAENLRLMLDAQNISASPQIIFVAHSMGGLVIRSVM